MEFFVVKYVASETISVSKKLRGPYPDYKAALAAAIEEFGPYEEDEYGRYCDEDSGDPVFGIVNT